jgi:hypothetical protein
MSGSDVQAASEGGAWVTHSVRMTCASVEPIRRFQEAPECQSADRKSIARARERKTYRW